MAKPGITFRRLNRLAHDQDGVALIEFALSLPILLSLSLVGVETAHYAIAVMRVNQIATSVADNVARVRDSISEADVNEALLSANLIGDSIDFGNRGRVVVSSISPNGLSGGQKGQWIRWQRCAGALNTMQSQPKYGAQGKGKSDGSLPYMGTASHNISPGGGIDMIFAEVTYRYKPIVGGSIIGTPILRAEASYSVRERENENLQTSSGAVARTCNLYSAN